MPKGIYKRSLKPTIKAGDKFNYLTAVKFHSKNPAGNQFWLFKCSCGIEKIISVSKVKRGTTKSCGCLRKEIFRKIGMKNIRHGMEGTKIYRIWAGMKTRCLNENHSRRKDYGGRGITVCDEWLTFENFYKDMGNCPKGKSLDRIDNNGNYCKSNCKWSTPKEQANNRRNNLIHNSQKV